MKIKAHETKFLFTRKAHTVKNICNDISRRESTGEKLVVVYKFEKRTFPSSINIYMYTHAPVRNPVVAAAAIYTEWHFV